MAIQRGFKLPEHTKFNYIPLYYNEQKEKLEQKRAEYQKQKEQNEKNTYKPEIKGAFTGKYHRTTSQLHKQSNLRIFIILIFLMIIAYLIISNSALMDKMFKILLG